MVTRFGSINIVVEDVARLTEFLEALGVDLDGVPPGWESWTTHHRSFGAASDVDADLDSSRFAADWGGTPAEFQGVVVNLRTDDRDAVDRGYAIAIEHGAVSRREPYDAFWGARFAVVESPFGIVFGLMSPSDPERGTAPTFTP
jgi:catechol 2,3-dioxygenase-like lactoylglutathione lyase family enzyme